MISLTVLMAVHMHCAKIVQDSTTVEDTTYTIPEYDGTVRYSYYLYKTENRPKSYWLGDVNECVRRTRRN